LEVAHYYRESGVSRCGTAVIRREIDQLSSPFAPLPQKDGVYSLLNTIKDQIVNTSVISFRGSVDER
jgi:hypothetical protein